MKPRELATYLLVFATICFALYFFYASNMLISFAGVSISVALALVVND